MKSLSSHLGSVVLAALLMLCLFLIAEDSFAEESELVPNDGTIEIIYPAEAQLPYRERRSNWSPTFAVQLEQILPDRYRSPVAGEDYQTLFASSPISMAQIQLGAKYNFGLGSLGASLVGATGEISDGGIGAEDTNANPDMIGEVATLKLQKYGFSASLYFDSIFPEPYAVPYLEGQIFRISWREDSKNFDDAVGTTGWASAFSAGILFQLNWLDPDSALSARNSSGLNNTYLDLFVSQYNSSDGEEDPDFQTSSNFGGGLRFEF